LTNKTVAKNFSICSLTKAETLLPCSAATFLIFFHVSSGIPIVRIFVAIPDPLHLNSNNFKTLLK
jgi:hypothetical protein